MASKPDMARIVPNRHLSPRPLTRGRHSNAKHYRLLAKFPGKYLTCSGSFVGFRRPPPLSEVRQQRIELGRQRPLIVTIHP
jgi:hypothetical protein